MYTLILVLATAWGQELQSVVIAAAHVPPGTSLSRSDLYVARFDPEHVPPNSFADIRSLVGRVTTEPLLPHAPIRAERLTPEGVSTGLPGRLLEGTSAVRLPLISASAWLRAGDRVDVLRVRGDESCYVADSVAILAGETADGTLWTDHRNANAFVALHIAAPQADAGPLAALDPRQTVFAARNPVDLAPTDPVLPRCDQPDSGVVSHVDDRFPRIGSGGARAWELLQGENAFLGKLKLPPGARIPAHRDATEEYLLILKGEGTVTIEGIAHPISEGSLVYMPARAKVSYINGAKPLEALQIFAGPSPATKYLDWRSTAPAPPPEAPAVRSSPVIRSPEPTAPAVPVPAAPAPVPSMPAPPVPVPEAPVPAAPVPSPAVPAPAVPDPPTTPPPRTEVRTGGTSETSTAAEPTVDPPAPPPVPAPEVPSPARPDPDPAPEPDGDPS